ncbi:hypothetical protein J6590_048956 [Homalodisca vitripennis]|nr:hypothetical protein J6590_048956 [Homalodisca vitripennis]
MYGLPNYHVLPVCGVLVYRRGREAQTVETSTRTSEDSVPRCAVCSCTAEVERPRSRWLAMRTTSNVRRLKRLLVHLKTAMPRCAVCSCTAEAVKAQIQTVEMSTRTSEDSGATMCGVLVHRGGREAQAQTVEMSTRTSEDSVPRCAVCSCTAEAVKAQIQTVEMSTRTSEDSVPRCAVCSCTAEAERPRPRWLAMRTTSNVRRLKRLLVHLKTVCHGVRCARAPRRQRGPGG